MLKINEIFLSIQGEGRYMGTPAIFIRTSGCPNNCSFCDTEHESYAEMTPAEVVSDALDCCNNELIKHVVLTGGEPMVQNADDLQKLAEMLWAKGFMLQIETSGVNGVTDVLWEKKPGSTFVTYSPKGNALKRNPYVPMNHIDEYKFIFPFESEWLIELYDRVNDKTTLDRKTMIAIQPRTVSNANDPEAAKGGKLCDDEYREAAYTFCLERGHLFSARLHVLLDFK